MGDEQIYAEKADFVKDELAAMLRKATCGWVTCCGYEHYQGVEVVHVGYALDEHADGRFDVNVTADSPWAIAKDVMRAVAERYE